MSRVSIGEQDLKGFIEEVIGKGGSILLKYGPGSAGDILLKEMLTEIPEGSAAVYLSTYETIDEMRSSLNYVPPSPNIEIFSSLDHREDELKRIVKRDRFMTEGIMVTDLLEVSMSERPVKLKRRGCDILSEITNSAAKQVLPFTLVLDSLDDLTEHYATSEVFDRLTILRRLLRSVNGIALIGSSMNIDPLKGKEVRLFDSILEAEAMKVGDDWERRLRLVHKRGDASLPREWALNIS
ncbi:MAG: hypothetical protein QCI82_06020 [Candidatus Thermoplasmatota archaeon]|nr:hypothetical protein [Candidatus Thermoplasmatota archaeon]